MKSTTSSEVIMLPHDTDTENAVLATLMRYNEKFDEYSDVLSKEMFYFDKERAIFCCIEGVIAAGGITDINSLCEYVSRHNLDYNLERLDFVNIQQQVSTATLWQDIQRLRDMSRRRMCWKLLNQASLNVLDLLSDFDDEVNMLLSAIGEVQVETSDDKVSSFGDALNEVVEIAKSNKSGFSNSLLTGFRLFDEHFLLRPGTFTVIAAFPAVGKSALALNIAVAVAKRGAASAYYSLEMGKLELASRAISEPMEMTAASIMNRPMEDGKMQELEDIKAKYSDLPIFFDDRSTVSFDRVIRSIRMMVKTKGIKLAIIDYLQIFNQITDDEEQGLSYMARMCKNIAKEMDIAVIALSQLNRKGDHPSLRMLRGSGQIEESADNVVLIDRPEAYPDNKVKKYEGEYKDSTIHNTAKLILSKGRGVKTGSSLLCFDGRYTTFYEMGSRPSEGYVEHEDDLPF